MGIRARRVNNYDLFASHAWYVPGVKGMFALLGWFLIGMILGVMIQALMLLFLPQKVVLDYSMIIIYPVQFLPAMLYVARKSQMNSLFEPGYKLSSNNFGPYSWWLVALVTVGLTLAMMISADLPNYWNYKLTTSVPFLKRFYDAFAEAMMSLTGGPFWSSFLVVAIFAPFFEEWLCRGMILRGLLTKMKPAWAIIISALFFALIHMNPWQALNAFIIGLVMGYVYYKTGNLLLTMLIHFINNGLGVVLGHIPSLENVDYWIDILSPQTYGIIYVLGVAALVGCYFFFRRIPLLQERGNVDEVTIKAD